jgi:PadR family transcriptional regulator, regulatory protein PadR
MMHVSARAAVLQALVSGSGYGLDLIERIRASSGGRITISQGSIYPALRDLENERLVWSTQGEPRQGRPRVHYDLTAKGRLVAMRTREAILGLFGPEAEGEGIL